ncbi:MAG TPA: hypothetical protein VJN66_08620 [Rhodanobacteraceae bacterium]|nr:hypothetical protein [Rhodanobacteraceae bacterium]
MAYNATKHDRAINAAYSDGFADGLRAGLHRAKRITRDLSDRSRDSRTEYATGYRRAHSDLEMAIDLALKE